MRGNVNFYLKKAEKNGLSLIFLKFKYSGNQFVYTFGETIKPEHWNKNKQRVKQNIVATTKDGTQKLNKFLDSLEEVVLNTYKSHLTEGVPPKAVLKEALDKYINQNKEEDDKTTFHNLLQRLIAGEILHKGKEKSISTLKSYKTVQGHLKEYEKKEKVTIDFDSINLDFLSNYIKFLRKDYKLSQNTIAKDVKILKTVMKKANTFQYTTNLWHKHEDFAAAWEATDSIYLKDSEILKLYRFDLSHNKRLEQVRDLFVFGSYVGLRFHDYSTIKPENIVTTINEDGNPEHFIKLYTQKTDELVIIPCNPVVMEIFDKYKDNHNRLPKSLSNQKFNEYIKEALKLAAYDDKAPVKELREKGRLATNPTLELWECVSSHTARRSFASNLYLEGFPVIDLMKITGHRTEKSFMLYIKISKEDTARRLKKHMQLEWSKKILKVA